MLVVKRRNDWRYNRGVSWARLWLLTSLILFIFREKYISYYDEEIKTRKGSEDGVPGIIGTSREGDNSGSYARG